MLTIVLNFGLYSQQSSSDDLEASGAIGPQQTGLHGEENCTEIAGHPTKKRVPGLFSAAMGKPGQRQKSAVASNNQPLAQPWIKKESVTFSCCSSQQFCIIRSDLV